MSKDDKKNEKKTVTVKYKGPKDSEPKTYELEIKDEEQVKDTRKFRNVRSNPFRTTFQIYIGEKDDTSGDN